MSSESSIPITLSSRAVGTDAGIGLGARAARPLPIARVLRDGDVTKFCQTTPDGYEIESVLIPMGARENTWHTLCVSSQIGCKRGCTFC